MMRTSAPGRGYTFFQAPDTRGRHQTLQASRRGSVRALPSTTIAVDHSGLKIAPSWYLLLVGLRTGATIGKATVRKLEYQGTHVAAGSTAKVRLMPSPRLLGAHLTWTLPGRLVNHVHHLSIAPWGGGARSASPWQALHRSCCRSSVPPDLASTCWVDRSGAGHSGASPPMWPKRPQ